MKPYKRERVHLYKRINKREKVDGDWRSMPSSIKVRHFPITCEEGAKKPNKQSM
jgi:hypothetical protein